MSKGCKKSSLPGSGPGRARNPSPKGADVAEPLDGPAGPQPHVLAGLPVAQVAVEFGQLRHECQAFGGRGSQAVSEALKPQFPPADGLAAVSAGEPRLPPPVVERDRDVGRVVRAMREKRLQVAAGLVHAGPAPAAPFEADPQQLVLDAFPQAQVPGVGFQPPCQCGGPLQVAAEIGGGGCLEKERGFLERSVEKEGGGHAEPSGEDVKGSGVKERPCPVQAG